MTETVNDVDEKTIVKEHINLLSRNNTTSLQADNVEGIGEINDLLMIEAGVTKINKPMDNWKIINSVYWMLWIMITRRMKMLRKLICWLLNYWKKKNIWNYEKEYGYK